EGEALRFTDIPVFAPEHFSLVQLKDPLRSKQLLKALDHLSEEGAIQVFRSPSGNEQILGAVGVLQFDVARYRIQHEYGVDVHFISLPYSSARWAKSERPSDLDALKREQSIKVCVDRYNRLTVLLDHDWRLKFLQDRHPKVSFHATNDLGV